MWTAAEADASPELLFVRWPANPDAVWYSFRIVPVTQHFRLFGACADGKGRAGNGTVRAEDPREIP